MARVELQRGLAYAPAQVMRHSGPMCLIDAIDDYGQDWIEASVDVRRDGLFCDDQGVPSWVGIEYMAQAIAAWSGIEQLQRGTRPSIGLLVGCRRYECAVERFTVGSKLRLRADILYRDEWDLGVFACSITEAAQTLVQSEVKVYRPHDLHAFLEQRRPAARST